METAQCRDGTRPAGRGRQLCPAAPRLCSLTAAPLHLSDPGARPEQAKQAANSKAGSTKPKHNLCSPSCATASGGPTASPRCGAEAARRPPGEDTDVGTQPQLHPWERGSQAGGCGRSSCRESPASSNRSLLHLPARVHPHSAAMSAASARLGTSCHGGSLRLGAPTQGAQPCHPAAPRGHTDSPGWHREPREPRDERVELPALQQGCSHAESDPAGEHLGAESPWSRYHSVSSRDPTTEPRAAHGRLEALPKAQPPPLLHPQRSMP